MKKNIYLIIISLITAGCIIGGALYHTGRIAGSLFGKYNNDEFSSKNISDGDKTEMFSKISVTADAMNLKVQNGKDYSLSYSGAEGLKPKYEIRDGELTVTQHNAQRNFFGLFSDYKATVVITVPDKAVLDEMNINMSVGNVDISGISSDACDIDSNVGDVNISECTINGTAAAESNTGNIDISDCSFNDMNLSDNTGNIRIDGVGKISDYKIDASTDLGDVKVAGSSYDNDCRLSGDTDKKISVSTNLGDVVISE